MTDTSMATGPLQTLMTHNTLLAATTLLVLGFWAFADRKADRRNEPLSGLLLSGSLWLYSYALWRTSVTPFQADFWLKTLFFIASFLPPFFVLLIDARRRGGAPRLSLSAALLVPNCLVFFVAYMTDTLVLRDGVRVLDNIGGRFLAAYFALFTVGAFDAVLRAVREEVIEDSRVVALVAGMFAVFPSLFAFLYFGDLSMAANPLWYGHFIAATLAAGGLLVAYAADPSRFHIPVHRSGLEAFAMVGVLALILDVVISQTPLSLAMRLVMLIVLVLVGSGSVRTAAREIARLREIELLNGELLCMNGQLIEADKMKTRFVSFVTHQLRAPLGGVRSYLDMLARGDFGPLNARQADIVATNIDAVGVMGQTVETFLDVAKVQLGQMKLFRKEDDVAAIVRRVVKELAPLAIAKRLRLTADLPRSAVIASCDSGKLHHAVANLVHNAIKYTSKGRVTVSVAGDADAVSVLVRDTGMGLTAAGKKRVNDLLGGGIAGVRFDETGGSGLGLYIVRNIVDAHGGTMIIESEGRGKGSAFGFRFPAR
jgi:signal transduction histidine kinase